MVTTLVERNVHEDCGGAWQESGFSRCEDNFLFNLPELHEINLLNFVISIQIPKTFL